MDNVSGAPKEVQEIDHVLEEARDAALEIADAVAHGKQIDWKETGMTLALRFHDIDKVLSRGAELPDAWLLD